MRKGHLSHKVPNVKLRPAPASQPAQRVVAPKTKYLKRKARQSQDDGPEGAEETQLVEQEPEEFDVIAQASRESKPLEGKIVCLTGLRDQRTELQNMARSLGAHVEMALTMDVTHLIADGVMSPKYKVAIDHGITCMSPSWLITLHGLYLTGEPITDLLIPQHTLKPLHGLQIGITGYSTNPPELRTGLISSIVENGGTYHASFKDTCTHLLVGPEADERSIFSNPKVLKALQFATTGTGVQVVWGEWMVDSLKMFGALEESRYDVRSARPASDRLVEPKCSQPSSSPNKLLRQETSTNLTQSLGGIKRQRNENGEESEVVGVKKRARPNASALSDLLGFGNTSASGAMEVDLPSVGALPQLQEEKQESQMKEVKESQVRESQIKRLASGRTASFVQSKPTKLDRSINEKTKPFPSVPVPNDTIIDDSGFQTISPQKPSQEKKIFDGAKIWLRGFPSDQVSLAARVCREERATVLIGGEGIGREDEMDWIVVPFLKDPPSDVDLDDQRVVTSYWIERCLFLNELIDASNLAFMAKPMPVYALRDAHKYELSHSGFDECDQNAIGKLCKALGISCSNKLAFGKTTHMVSFSEEGRKAIRAREAGLPVHGISFLLELIGLSQKDHEENLAEQERKREAEERAMDISVSIQQSRDISVDQSRESQQPDGAPVGPLNGCVIFTSKKVSHNRQKIIETVNKLGGRFAHDYKSDVTHLLHSSTREKEQFHEFKKHKKAKKHICHPRWLEECLTKDLRVEERNYPHTWQSNKQLSYVVAGSQSQASGSRSQSRSVTPSVSRRSSTESHKGKEKAQPESDDLPPPLEMPQSAPAPRESILAGLEEMDEMFVPPALTSMDRSGPDTQTAMASLQQSLAQPKSIERSASAEEIPMEPDMPDTTPASASLPRPTATLEAPRDPSNINSSATVMGSPPKPEDASGIENATPGPNKSNGGLTEDMMEHYRTMFGAPGLNTSSGSSAGKAKKKVRPIDRRRNESITSRPASASTDEEQLFKQSDARPMRLPFDMSQSQAHRFDDLDEPEESWRITVVDPEAAKARAELLGEVYVPPKGHVLDLSPVVDKRRSSRRG